MKKKMVTSNGQQHLKSKIKEESFEVAVDSEVVQ